MGGAGGAVMPQRSLFSSFGPCRQCHFYFLTSDAATHAWQCLLQMLVARKLHKEVILSHKENKYFESCTNLNSSLPFVESSGETSAGTKRESDFSSL